MLSFNDKVVVITGAARGIGVAYAHFFASREATLLLNDNGEENGVFLIDKLATTLSSKYPQVRIATNHDSVENGHLVIEAAIAAFKKIDVLVNNAGILIDKGLTKITKAEFDKVLRVHTKGTFRCTHAAWPYFRKQKYGRIINTGSSTGLYGNFGQVNYSAAKAGIHGMTLALAKEGANYNIKVNCIAPMAQSRMTETVIPADIIKAIPASGIAPFVGLLAHEECPESGQMFEIGGGWVAKVRWQRTEGGSFPLDFTPEMLKANWKDVVDYTRKNDYPVAGGESIERMFENYEKQTEKAKEVQKKSDSQSETIYALMKTYVEGGMASKAVQKCNSTYQFNLTDKKSGKMMFQFWVSVKKDEQKAGTGSYNKPDATFQISEEDFNNVCLGKLNPQVAFAKRLMKISGNFKKASAFTPDLFPKPTKENIEKYLKIQPKL